MNTRHHRPITTVLTIAVPLCLLLALWHALHLPGEDAVANVAGGVLLVVGFACYRPWRGPRGW